MKTLIQRSKNLLIALASTLIMVACVSDQIAPKEVELPDEVFFSTDVQPIFDASCNVTGCHDGTVSPNLLPADNLVTILLLTGMVDTVTTDNSTLLSKIEDGGSMESYATDQDRAIIRQWIEQNAPDN